MKSTRPLFHQGLPLPEISLQIVQEAYLAAFFTLRFLCTNNRGAWQQVIVTQLVPDRKPRVWVARRGAMLTKLPIYKAQKILKPVCTTVHEARFIIWQDFAATQ